MTIISREKKSYHDDLMDAVQERYIDSEEKKKLIPMRMNDAITTHMSSKRAMEKRKKRAKMVQS